MDAPLAWTADGDPFVPHPNCHGWRVYKTTERGRTAYVPGPDGPLHIELSCNMAGLREACGPGEYSLIQVDEHGKKLSEAPPARVVCVQGEPRSVEPQSSIAETTLLLVQEVLKSQEQTTQHLRGLLTELIQGLQQIQLATAELLRSGNDAVTVASGAGLPEHIAGLLGNSPQEQKSALESILNSPLVASTAMGFVQAMQQAKPQEETAK